METEQVIVVLTRSSFLACWRSQNPCNEPGDDSQLAKTEHESVSFVDKSVPRESVVAIEMANYHVWLCKLLKVDSTMVFSEMEFTNMQDIFTGLKIWKLIASVFTFSSTPELFFGLYLLYYFRVFERQIGSNKYSVFILFSTVVSVLLEVVALAVFKDSAVNQLTPGPYGVIFASFVPFFFDIPVSTMFRVFGVRFSNKSFIYLAGLQLLLSSWKRSIVPGLCGLLAGSLFRLNLFGIRKLKLPDFVSSFFSRLAWPPAGSSRGASSRNAVGSSPSYAGRSLERTYPAPTAPSIEPPDGSIATLEAMGFDRNSARQALIQARNDINVATNILLEALSH